jgi:hypothetical protein
MFKCARPLPLARFEAALLPAMTDTASPSAEAGQPALGVRLAAIYALSSRRDWVGGGQRRCSQRGSASLSRSTTLPSARAQGACAVVHMERKPFEAFSAYAGTELGRSSTIAQESGNVTLQMTA